MFTLTLLCGLLEHWFGVKCKYNLHITHKTRKKKTLCLSHCWPSLLIPIVNLYHSSQREEDMVVKSLSNFLFDNK
jgi:hypothetical protein